MADRSPEDLSFSEAQRIQPEAIGEPGQRRFRILAIINDETRIVWLEKEQLRSLAIAIDQVLDNLDDKDEPTSATSSLLAFDFNSRNQIRAGRIELGYDEPRDLLVIIIHDIEAASDAGPSFTCRLTRVQAEDFAEESETVISAGRPACPMCGLPMDPAGHTCAKQNGHFPHRMDEVLLDETEE